MYRVTFLLDEKGESEALTYITKLKEKPDKSSRIKYNKINDYLTALATYGLSNPSNIIKHLLENIWELRPLRDRFIFADVDEQFLILHRFFKKTQRTPKREIQKAIHELEIYLSRKEKGNEQHK